MGDELTWLRERLEEMTAGPLRVNDADAPNYWLEQIHGPERFVVADFRENEVHDPEANAIGFGVLRNVAPSMLAVIEAAPDVECCNFPPGSGFNCYEIEREPYHDFPCLACAKKRFLAAVREEQDRC